MSHVNLFDISHWNATADFKKAKAAGHVGVYLKATDGSNFVDPTFAPRVVAAKAAGLHVGAYLFFHPDQNVQAQVDLFYRTVGHLCDLKPALDHETAPAGMTPGAIAGAAFKAMTAMSRGDHPILYTYRSFITEGYAANLGKWPLWIADYSGGPAPIIPDIWTTYVMWQTGQQDVPGISPGDGPGVDFDQAPSLEALLALRPPPVNNDSPLLMLGSKGQKVKDVQHALNLCGNDIPEDGSFGPLTVKILKVFQGHRKLKMTGTTTPETWAALRLVAHPNQ